MIGWGGMPEISIRAEELFRIGSWPVTNAVLLSCLALAVLSALAFFIRRQLKPVPGRLQSLFELFLEELLDIMDAVLGSRERSLRYLPLVATIFLFILTANWLGLLPFGGVGLTTPGPDAGPGTPAPSHAERFIPLLRAPASDLNFTLALALISVLSANILGIAAVGFRRHAGKFFTIKTPIAAFTGLLELVSEFVRIISFSFRLFGNVFAGEVLLAIIGFLVPYLLPLPFLFLEVFVGFIQAFIFAMLTLVSIGMAASLEPAH